MLYILNLQYITNIIISLYNEFILRKRNQHSRKENNSNLNLQIFILKMKNKLFNHFAFALSIIVLLACSEKKQSKEKYAHTDTLTAVIPNYAGIYKTEKGCNLNIELIKTNNGYKYLLTGEHYDQEGIAIIDKSDAIYITFDGPIGNNEPKTVSGQIDGNSILIQNYGNSMNEYHYFVDCDEKFLEFVKQ